MIRELSPKQILEYDHVPRSLLEGVRLVTVPFLTPGADAMTLGRVILIRRGHEDSETLLAHELVHVEQWAELGVPRFLIRYLGAYVKNLLRLRRHRPAYLAIPLEEEARQRARQWRTSSGSNRKTHPD